MEFKDYYRILGLEKTAPGEDIKKAFRKLARKYHPDVSKEANAAARMAELNEANAVLADPEKRDAMLSDKIQRLRQKLQTLWPQADATISHAWCGAFGETSDGLPLIGPVPGASNIHAAYGYGGNGITFSYLASRMIAATIAGDNQAWFENFALDRPDKN